LETEEIRDSILASSGQLDLSHPSGSPDMTLRMIEVFDDGPVVKSVLNAADRSRYRSIYLPQLRGEVPRPLAAFDPVTQAFVTGQRDETTVPTQALFMLNSPFVREQSLDFANTLVAAKYPTPEERIRYAYERVLARDPRPQEMLRAKAFISRYSATWIKTHPGSPATGAPHVVNADTTNKDITAGIVREDNRGQDDPDDTTKEAAEEAQKIVLPDNAKQAAWAALVQSLYGSAEFQFVR
jgi:hypothetical protein